jgi:anti-anti-sigma factor
MFSHTIAASGRQVVIALAGESDLTASDRLQGVLFDAIARRPSCITVDLKALTFIDSMSIGTLVAARRAAHEHRVGFKVVNARGNVHLVLRISGMLDVLSGSDDGELFGDEAAS